MSKKLKEATNWTWTKNMQTSCLITARIMQGTWQWVGLVRQKQTKVKWAVSIPLLSTRMVHGQQLTIPTIVCTNTMMITAWVKDLVPKEKAMASLNIHLESHLAVAGQTWNMPFCSYSYYSYYYSSSFVSLMYSKSYLLFRAKNYIAMLTGSFRVSMT